MSRFICRVIIISLLFVGGYCQGQEPKVQNSSEQKVEKIITSFANFQKNLSSFSMDIISTMHIKRGTVSQNKQEYFSFVAQKPNSLAMVHQSGIMGPTVVCDGTNIYAFVPEINQYTVKKAPLSFTDFFSPANRASAMIQQIIPLVDALLSSSPREIIMRDIISSEYLGLADIDSIKCHHLILSQKDFAWELWLDAGNQPFIHRIMVNISSEDVNVDFIWDFKNWQVNTTAKQNAFRFIAPLGSRQVEEYEAPSPVGSPHQLTGQQGPEFQLEQLDGSMVSLSKHKGDIVILDFWATWCPPCRVALPILADVASKYKDKSVVFYAVNQMESSQKIHDFLKTTGLKLNVLLDKDGSVAGRYGVVNLPQTVIIGPNGKVNVVHIGISVKTEKDLISELDSLIAGDDLLCSEFQLLPKIVKPNEKIVFKAVIKNSGKKPMLRGDYFVGLTIDNEQVFYGPGTSDIAPGGTAQYSTNEKNWYFQILSPGSHTYTFEVDPFNLIPEIDKSNNSIRGTFNVEELKPQP